MNSKEDVQEQKTYKVEVDCGDRDGVTVICSPDSLETELSKIANEMFELDFEMDDVDFKVLDGECKRQFVFERALTWYVSGGEITKF